MIDDIGIYYMSKEDFYFVTKHYFPGNRPLILILNNNFFRPMYSTKTKLEKTREENA